MAAAIGVACMVATPEVARADGSSATVGQEPQGPEVVIPLVSRRTLDERFPDGIPSQPVLQSTHRLRSNRHGQTVYRDPEGRFVATVRADGSVSFRDKFISFRNRRIMSPLDVVQKALGTERHKLAKRAFMRETYENRLAMRVEWTLDNLREAERRLWGELQEIWRDESQSRLERGRIIRQRWEECDVDVDLAPVAGKVSIVDKERRTVARRARRTIEHFVRLYVDPDPDFGEVTPEHDAAVALAPDLFEECERDAKACIAVGDLLVGRRANAYDADRGASYYARACEADDPWACYELAVLHYLGLGVEQDDRRAAELHTVACEAGVADGCAYLAFLHRKGFGVPQSDEQGSRYRQLACEMGLEEHCNRPAASLLVATTASPE